MEIAITDEKELRLTIYAVSKNIGLTIQDWNEISERAKVFLPKALADEDAV